MRDTVLFLCVANSARSQMAEALLRRQAIPGLTVASAGSAPQALHPTAIRVMEEIGLDISSHESKSVADLDPARVAVVVTLCAEDVCPTFPGEIRRLHWPMDDPVAFEGDEELLLSAFRRARDDLADRIRNAVADGTFDAISGQRQGS